MYPSDASKNTAIPMSKIGRVPRLSISQPDGGRISIAIAAKSPMMSPICDEVPPRLAT